MYYSRVRVPACRLRISQIQDRKRAAHEAVNQSNQLESGYLQAHTISRSAYKEHIAKVHDCNPIEVACLVRCWACNIPEWVRIDRQAKIRRLHVFRCRILTMTLTRALANVQTVAVSVLMNHAWSHLRSGSTAHFKKTLLTR